jgi:hypothetical protein
MCVHAHRNKHYLKISSFPDSVGIKPSKPYHQQFFCWVSFSKNVSSLYSISIIEDTLFLYEITKIYNDNKSRIFSLILNISYSKQMTVFLGLICSTEGLESMRSVCFRNTISLLAIVMRKLKNKHGEVFSDMQQLLLIILRVAG